MAMPVELVEIQSLAENDRTPEEQTKLDAYLSTVDTLTEKLGELTDSNDREAFANKLLLALCKGETPAPEDVQKLEDAITAYDEFVAGVELPPAVPTAEK